jgi:hypothetical protein
LQPANKAISSHRIEEAAGTIAVDTTLNKGSKTRGSMVPAIEGGEGISITGNGQRLLQSKVVQQITTPKPDT